MWHRFTRLFARRAPARLRAATTAHAPQTTPAPHPNQQSKISNLKFLFLLAFALSACSLAGDITPPPGARATADALATARAAASATPATAAPIAQLDALAGGYLFQQHCAACHGPAGEGNGDMVAQLPAPPPDFSDPATLRNRSPVELYSIVTAGRLEAFMPPFADVLTDAQRWDTVAFLYSLSASPDSLAAGQAVYAAECAACHGPTGEGDGPDAGTAAPPDLTDAALVAGLSQQALFNAISGSSPPHPFAERLSEADRWAAVDYVRTLSFGYAAVDEVLAERTGNVTGQIVNGTAGAAAPGGLPVALHAFENDALVATLTTTASADGGFVFDEVPLVPGRQYLATTEYQGLTYGSEPAGLTGDDTLRLTVPVYEGTTDTAALSVDQVHTFLDFSTPGELTVGQLFVFSNSGDRTFVPDSDTGLRFGLPDGAHNVTVQGGQVGENYFITAQGFEALWPVRPGQASGQILFSFRVPYESRLDYAQTVHYPVGRATILVPDSAVQLSGPALQPAGVQTVQGQQFQAYTASGLASGDSLAFTVTGRPGAGPSTVPRLVSNPASLAVGLAALAAVLLGAGLWLYRRAPRAGQAPAPAAGLAAQSDDDLLRAIAALDDAREAGEIEQAAYVRERAALKHELKNRWARAAQPRHD